MKRKRDKPKADVPAQCGRERDGWVYATSIGGCKTRSRPDYRPCQKRKAKPRAR